jgi:hypothetical protein
MDKKTFFVLADHFWPDMFGPYREKLWEWLQEAQAEGHDPHEVIDHWYFTTLRSALVFLRGFIETDCVAFQTIRSQPFIGIKEVVETAGDFREEDIPWIEEYEKSQS